MMKRERALIENNPAPESKDSGIMLLIDKPKEYTSARVVNIVKKILSVKKAGHSGTLDPKATGLLVICTGKKTKFLNELLGSDKEYEGIMVLGEKTPSYDTETGVYEKNPVNNLNDEMILRAAQSFTGEIEQVPPMHSAVKIKGRPLYKLARAGKEVARAPRKVNIKEFDITEVNIPHVKFRILCSKGTYIRTLVSDFGDKLGAGAYLKELRRTRIGVYDIKDSLTLEQFISQYRN